MLGNITEKLLRDFLISLDEEIYRPEGSWELNTCMSDTEGKRGRDKRTNRMHH